MSIFTIIYNYKEIILLLVFVFVIIYWFLKPKVLKPDYFSKDYWEKRYNCHSKKFEWYNGLERLNKDFNFEELLKDHTKAKSKILEIGCGTSDLSFSLANKGFCNLYAIDYSLTAIDLMKKNFSHKNLTYLVLSFYDLNLFFGKNEIDVIIDKAGIDTINTLNDLDIIRENLNKVFNEIYKVLKKGGIVFNISNKNKEFWKENIYDNIVKEGKFEYIDTKQSTFTTDQNSNLMKYYLHIIKKL